MPKHVIISKLGGHEVLKYQEYSLPNEIKVNEVRIKQYSIGLNYIDTYHRSGIYPLPSDLPVCPGMEAAGEVIGIGPEVVNFKIGDRVAYATPPIGAYCEIRDFPEDKLISIPDFLTNEKLTKIYLELCKMAGVEVDDPAANKNIKKQISNSVKLNKEDMKNEII